MFRLSIVAGAAAVLIAVAWSGVFQISTRSHSMAADSSKKPGIVHDVYFTLNESTSEGRAKLMAACKKCLTDHPGVTYFGVGVVAEELKRPVNDRDWDVGLHMIFKSQADHDAYQNHPRHLQFIEENKSNWKKVRVFDTEVE
jgi:hypothetical protein